jgi:hypothetical protein
MIDLTKINDAVAKVADLAKSSVQAHIDRDAAYNAVGAAQLAIDALADQLLSAATTPAEAAGIAAVADALTSTAAE